MAPCRETLGFRPTIITNASLVSFQVWSQEYFQLWYFSPKKNYYQVFCFVLRWGFWDYFFLFVLFYLSVAEGHKESSAVLCSQKNQITLKNLVTLVFTPSQIPPFSVDLCGSADDLLPPWKPVYFCLFFFFFPPYPWNRYSLKRGLSTSRRMPVHWWCMTSLHNATRATPHFTVFKHMPTNS